MTLGVSVIISFPRIVYKLTLVLDEISLLANVTTHMYLDILTSTPSIKLFYMFFSQFECKRHSK